MLNSFKAQNTTNFQNNQQIMYAELLDLPYIAYRIDKNSDLQFSQRKQFCN
jgi:hypothetical protein